MLNKSFKSSLWVRAVESKCLSLLPMFKVKVAPRSGIPFIICIIILYSLLYFCCHKQSKTNACWIF